MFEIIFSIESINLLFLLNLFFRLDYTQSVIILYFSNIYQINIQIVLDYCYMLLFAHKNSLLIILSILMFMNFD